MQAARSDRAWRRPWVQLGMAVALLVVAVVVALGASGQLGIGSLRLTESPQAPAPADAELFVALSGAPGQVPDSRLFRTAQDVVTAQLQSDPAVASVRTVERPNGVTLVVGFGDAGDAEREDAVVRLAEGVDPGVLRARVDGELPRLIEARDELEDELWRKQLLVLPLSLLVLGAAAGLRRAVAPLLCAAIAIAGSLALLRLVGMAADVSLLGFAPAAVVGLVLGIELPLRALRAQAPPELDPRLALAIAGIAALPGFALLATPLEQAASIALGCAFAALLAAGATLLVGPAIAALAPAAHRPPARERRRWPRPRLTMVLAVVALCLLVAATTYASTAPVIALDAFGGGGWPARASGDSLSAELPLVAAIAIPAVSLALAWLAASPLGLLLGPLSLLSAAATLGACALLSEHGWGIGNDDPAGTFFDTGVAAITVCAIAAIACVRSASAAIALWAGSRIELVPALAATAVGLLAAGALYATRAPLADDLAVALAAGLVIDLVLVRLPLSALVNRRIGSRGE